MSETPETIFPTSRVVSPRASLFAAALLSAVLLPTGAWAASAPVAAPGAAPDDKAVAITSQLLLPYYQVESGNISGDSTLFAVRNEGLETISVTASFFEIDSPQAPQRTEIYLLGPKQIRTVNIRDVPNLEIDEDGFARGYITFATGQPDHRIHGDYYQVTPGEAFATGARMVDISDASPFNELCSNVSLRFLQGGAFSGGTEIVFWIDSASLPLPANAITFSVYSESGGEPVFTSNLPVDTVAGTVEIDQLLGPFAVNFGAVELQLASGLVGHFAATLSASGQFSVRVEGTCRD